MRCGVRTTNVANVSTAFRLRSELGEHCPWGVDCGMANPTPVGRQEIAFRQPPGDAPPAEFAPATPANAAKRAQVVAQRGGRREPVLRPDHSLGSQHAGRGGPDMLWPLRLATPKPIRHLRFEAS